MKRRSWTDFKAVRLSCVILLGLFSCNTQEEIIPVNTDINFYPVESGVYRIYEVNEINYTFTEDPDTLNYLLREVIGDTTRVSGDEVTVLVNLYTKDIVSDTIPWKLTETISATRNQTSATEIIENNPTIKIVFPLSENLRWDANARSSEPSDAYEMREVNERFENQFLNFDNSVSIYQNENLDSLIFRDYRKEVFAEDIGLIHREFEVLSYCQEVDCFGQQIVEEGFKINQTLIEFGKQ